MEIRPIRTDQDRRAAPAEIDACWGAIEGSEEGDKLDVLVSLVESYEAKRWPIESENSFDVQLGQCSGGQPSIWPRHPKWESQRSAGSKSLMRKFRLRSLMKRRYGMPLNRPASSSSKRTALAKASDFASRDTQNESSVRSRPRSPRR